MKKSNIQQLSDSYKAVLKKKGLWCTQLQISIIQLFLSADIPLDTVFICTEISQTSPETKKAAICSAIKQLCKFGILGYDKKEERKNIYRLQGLEEVDNENPFISSMSEMVRCF
jgi:Fe2+ or Zn2+ uptake regulation protein